MEDILCLSLKENFIRNDIFLPVIDFRLLAFGVDFLVGSGFQREHTVAIQQVEDAGPISDASLPNSSFLDDILMPDGISILERTAYFGSRTILMPQIAASYLFSQLKPKSSLLYPVNPRYLVYSQFMFQGSVPYNGGYFQTETSTEYFAEEAYTPIGQPRQTLRYQNSASTPYAAQFSMQVSSIKAYGNLAPDRAVYYTPSSATTNAKPVEVAREFASPKTKPAAEMIYAALTKPDDISQIRFSLQEPSLPTLDLRTELSRMHLQNPETQSRHIYANTQHYQLPSFTASPKTAKIQEPKLEARLQPFYSAGATIYEKPKAVQTKNNGRNKNLQEIQLPRAYAPAFARNYDMPLAWINIPSSYFWRSPALLHYLGAISHVRYDGNPKSKINAPYYRKATHAKRKHEVKYKGTGPAETGNETKPATAKYANKNEDKKMNDSSDAAVKPNYQVNGSDEKYEDKPSAMAYAGAAAGMGLVGLAALAAKGISLLKKDKPSITSNDAKDQINNQSSQSLESAVQTHTKFFNSDSNKEIGNLIREAEALGAEVYLHLFHMSDGSSYAYNANVSVPSASLNKVAIVYALASMWEDGLIDIEREVPYIRELVLEREIVKHRQFSPDGNKSFKLRDLSYLGTAESGNTPIDLILYALGSNGTYKENQTKKEIGEQVRRGIEKVNYYMQKAGFFGIKVRSPYLDKKKLEAIDFKGIDHTDNVTTAEETNRFNVFIKKGGNLEPQYLELLAGPMSDEQTSKYWQDILGGVDFGKPGVDMFNNGYTFVKGNIAGTIILKHKRTNPIYGGDLVDKSELSHVATDYGKSILNYLAKYFTGIHNLINPSAQKQIKPPFPEALQPEYRKAA